MKLGGAIRSISLREQVCDVLGDFFAAGVRMLGFGFDQLVALGGLLLGLFGVLVLHGDFAELVFPEEDPGVLERAVGRGLFALEGLRIILVISLVLLVGISSLGEDAVP